MKLIILTIFVIINYINCQHFAHASQCKELNPQNVIDMDEIQGLWYGYEIITHINAVNGKYENGTTVLIYLLEKTHAPDQFDEHHNQQAIPKNYTHPPPNRAQYHKYLQLIWAEPDVIVEYTLRYNTTRRGFWIASVTQKGTMLKLNSQFNGTIQVMKAVANYMLLTFCSELPESQFFSIVFSRDQYHLSADDLQSAHSLLARRGLQTVSIQSLTTSPTPNGSGLMYNNISFVSLLLTTINAFLLKEF